MPGPVRSRIDLPDGRTIFIRRPEYTDMPALKAFFEALGPESIRLFLPHPYTEPVLRRRIERSLDGDDLVYLAWFESRAAGYFFLWNYNQPVCLLGIGLADDFQNLKLGQKFMALLIEDARLAGRDGIELTTMLDNDRAFHVYEKLGFRYIGNVENIVGDGRTVIERAMFFPLKPGARPMSTPHKCPE
jgi:ribosomal protein S18 acetylase RimI-like enzyme